MLINVKMPTITSISRINFMLIWVGHEKRFITLEPEMSSCENDEQKLQSRSNTMLTSVQVFGFMSDPGYVAYHSFFFI